MVGWEGCRAQGSKCTWDISQEPLDTAVYKLNTLQVKYRLNAAEQLWTKTPTQTLWDAQSTCTCTRATLYGNLHVQCSRTAVDQDPDTDFVGAYRVGMHVHKSHIIRKFTGKMPENNEQRHKRRAKQRHKRTPHLNVQFQLTHGCHWQ